MICNNLELECISFNMYSCMYYTLRILTRKQHEYQKFQSLYITSMGVLKISVDF